MSWRDTIQPQKPTSGGWRSNVAPMTTEPEQAPPKVTYGPESRIGQALGQGFVQGVTLDSADELRAQIRALVESGKFEDILKQEREYGRGLEEQHPVASAIGRLPGYLIPGGIAAKATKTTSALGRTGVESALGALQGYGASEGQDKLESMAEGAGMGAVGSVGVDLAGKAARYGLQKAGDLFGSIFLNTPTEVTRVLRKDPTYLDKPKDTLEIGDELAKALQKTRSSLLQSSERALDTLQDTPLRDKIPLMQEIEGLAGKYSVSPATAAYPESKAIMNEIQLARDALNMSVNESDIKMLLRRLSNKADYDTVANDQINNVRKDIRYIIDQSLKSQNPEYREAMIPVSRLKDNLDDALKVSGMNEGGSRYIPTDRTTARLETLMNQIDKSKGEISRGALEKVYPNIREELRKQRLSRQGEGGVTAGSRNIALGIGTGALLDMAGITGGAGGVGGFFLGGAIDKYGRTVGSAVARNAGRAGRFLDKYGDYFKSAANKELTHQFLMNVDPEYKQMFGEMQENFSNPEQITDILGSAVLGPDLTRLVGSTGAGLGSLSAGGDFGTGFEERFNQYNENQSGAQGIASLVNSALPTAKLGKFAGGLVKGVRLLDELTSDTGRTRSAPSLMRVKLPSGDKFPSSIDNGKDVKKAIDQMDLGSDNSMRVISARNDTVEGYITHPDYPDHTTFTFKKDPDGTWTLNSNFRKDKYADVPELKGSSTRMRQQVARALGGIGSDSTNANTTIGMLSYLKDPESILTRPNISSRKREQPRSKFYTPGSESQREEFMNALEQSYGSIPSKERAKESILEEARREVERRRRVRERLKEQEARERELKAQKEDLRNRLMNDPQFEPMRKAATERKQELIDDYMQALESGTLSDIRDLEYALTPDPSSLRRILETPEGKRSDLKQNEIMSEMLRENRPWNREGLREKRNAAIDRIDREAVQGEWDRFNRYKDADFDSIMTTLSQDALVPERTRNWFNEYTANDLQEIIEVNKQKFKQLRNRGLEAIQEHNIRDLRYYNIVNDMEQAIIRAKVARKALKMHEDALNTAKSVFNSDMPYEKMLSKMEPYIKESSGFIAMESMRDVKDIINQFKREDNDVLEAIVKDNKVLPRLSWNEILENAVMRKAAKEELARRKKESKK